MLHRAYWVEHRSLTCTGTLENVEQCKENETLNPTGGVEVIRANKRAAGKHHEHIEGVRLRV